MKPFRLAIPYDIHEKHPPSCLDTIRHFAGIAKRHNIDIDIVGQFVELRAYDGLWVRETIWTSHRSFRFIVRAHQIGIPSLDSVHACLSLESKIPMYTIMEVGDVMVPYTINVSVDDDMADIANRLGYPFVVKIPDGTRSIGMVKVENRIDAQKAETLFSQSCPILMAQRFMKTDYDWRIGVLDGRAIYAVQYLFPEGHWQIIKHEDDGSEIEGTWKAFHLKDIPVGVRMEAEKAARLFGDGLFGVDVKVMPENAMPYVMEVNHNPTLDAGDEDNGNPVWDNICEWFLERRVK